MKLEEIAGWTFGGGALGWATLWATNSKLKAERRKDDEARSERLRLERLDAERQTSDAWRELVARFEAREGQLQARIDHLQETVDKLRAEMHERTERYEGVIDQLRGENRQLKQLGLSTARVKGGDPT